MTSPVSAAVAASARRMPPGSPRSHQDVHTADTPAPVAGHASRQGTRFPVPARAFLAGYARAVGALLASVGVVLLGWSLVSSTEWVSSHPWWTATAASTIWALAAAGWLRRRGWRGRSLHGVTWAAPAALLLPLVWIGWVSPGELLLWGPVTGVFGVALAMAADPMASHVS